MAELELLISEADTRDAEDLVALLAQLKGETDYITYPQILEVEEMAVFLENQASSMNSICLLARLDGQAVAVLNLNGLEEAGFEHTVDLFIAVKKAYWRHGLASYLLEVGLDWAQETEFVKRIELTVQARNKAARALYEKFGFALEGIKCSAFRCESEQLIDICLMAKLID